MRGYARHKWVTEAAARLVAAFAPFAWRYKLAEQRHRSRLVTRNKQRRNW